MKKTIITIAFALVASVSAYAQNNSPAKPEEKPISILLTPTQISLTQQVLKFSYDALLTSDSPSIDVQQVRKAIEKIFPLFHGPVALPDSTKTPKPIKK